MKKLVIVAILAVSTVIVSAADVFGPAAGPPSGVSTALMKLFGKNNAFSANADVKIAEGKRESTSMVMKMAYLDGKIRTDMDMADMKSADLPADAIAQMKQMGMDKMSSIIEPEKKTMVLIYPSMKAYAEMALPAEEAEKAGKEPKVDKQEIGKETVEGHPCVKNKVTITSDDGKTQQFTVWTATDMKDFPIKSEFNESGSTITVVYRDIQLTKPAATQFEPPAGFKKYNNLQEMMMQKMLESQGGKP